MTDFSAITKDQLLQRSEEQYAAYEQFLRQHSPEHLTELSDAAGWTAKDHLYHLALAEGSLLALLEREPIHEYMGVDLETYRKGDDAVNAVVQARTHDLPLAQVLDMLRQNHARVMERIRATPDAELQRPFTDYQPGADPRGTVMLSLVYNTFHHYQEHLPWIQAIVEEK